MIVQNWWSASVQGASPLQGGSPILYSLFSGLAMLYIYIISIGCYISIASHYRRIFVQCLSLSAYVCPIPVSIGVYLSNACHYRRIFVQCLSEIIEHIISLYVFEWFGTNPGTLRNTLDLPDLPEVSHLLQFGTSSTCSRRRITSVVTNSVKWNTHGKTKMVSKLGHQTRTENQ